VQISERQVLLRRQLRNLQYSGLHRVCYQRHRFLRSLVGRCSRMILTMPLVSKPLWGRQINCFLPLATTALETLTTSYENALIVILNIATLMAGFFPLPSPSVCIIITDWSLWRTRDLRDVFASSEMNENGWGYTGASGVSI
jgi:hypothetical protein